jgi:hypothetical protein
MNVCRLTCRRTPPTKTQRLRRSLLARGGVTADLLGCLARHHAEQVQRSNMRLFGKET